MPCPELYCWQIGNAANTGKAIIITRVVTTKEERDIKYFTMLHVLSSSLCMPCQLPLFFFVAYYSTSVGTVFAAAAASLNFLHALRCPPFFQCCTWHSRPQYCTVRHNLQGFKGRNGVLGLPQVEQQRMVGVVRPWCLSNI